MQDIAERELWSSYQKAYEDVLNRCNTEYAPWYIVPADRKWYRNLVVSELLLESLRSIDPQYPEVEQDYSGIVIR